MEGIARYLIVCPLVFLGGFVDAIAGGGGLISLPAYLIAGLPVHASIGTNKISSAMGTTLTTFRFWRKGYVRAKLSLLCALFALVGSTCGANLALLVDDQIFKILLLFILPLTALYVFKSKSMETAGKEPLSPAHRLSCQRHCSGHRRLRRLLWPRYRHLPAAAFDGPGPYEPERRRRNDQGDKSFHQHRRPGDISHQRSGVSDSGPDRRYLRHCRQLPGFSVLYHQGGKNRETP